MNIKNIDVSNLRLPDESDILKFFFAIQKDYMSQYEIDFIDIDTKDGQAKLREIASYVVEELYEAINCLKIRPWTNTEMPVDVAHYKEELVDALAFFIQLLVLSNIEPTELKELYIKKYAVNKFRAESGY